MKRFSAIVVGLLAITGGFWRLRMSDPSDINGNITLGTDDVAAGTLLVLIGALLIGIAIGVSMILSSKKHKSAVTPV